MDLPKRKQNRLQTYDYSQPGCYFITICTKDRKCIFARVGRGILDAPPVKLTEYGTLVQQAVGFLNQHSPTCRVDKYVIMPNHVHLMVTVSGTGDGASGKPRPTDATIPKFVSSLKRFTNRKAGVDLWQTSYHDHIIRTDPDYLRIWQYVDTNPAKWREDCYYTETEG